MTSSYVPVSKEDTYALIEKAQKGDEESKTLLCRQNTGLVKKLALKFSAGEHELDDLIQIGYIGLLKAVEKFQPEFDVMFSTYAVPMILGEIRRFFRDNGKIKASRSLKSEIYTMNRLQEELAAAGGSAGEGKVKLSFLAETMGITVEHLLEVMEASQALSNVASLDNQLVEEEYENYYTQASPEHQLDNIMMKSEISRLPVRERQVILLRYYRDMTQQEIAGRMGISQVQVSRLEKKALLEMKKKMAR